MLFVRIALILLYSRALAVLALSATGGTGGSDQAPDEAAAGEAANGEPDTVGEAVGEAVEETVEALSDNAMTRAPAWVRWSMGVIAPLLGLLGLAVSSVALVAANTGWVLPVVGEVTGDWPLAILLITLALWAVWLLWQVPRWQAAAWRRTLELSEREIFDIENSSRATLGQILSGVAVLAGLIFAWQQLGNTSQTLFVSQEGQITDRFTRAVVQLGDEDLTIRLGGIYALERIARDSERDHETVMEILAAFVRQRSAADAAAAEDEAAGAGTPVGMRDPAQQTAMLEPGQAVTAMDLPSIRGIPLDIDVVLKVISRRDSTRDGPDCIDLSGTRLTKARLTGSNLNLTNLCLRNVDLRSAILGGVDFSGADLFEANFSGAYLDGANLTDAQLTGAQFPRANLSQADFTGATLTGAILQGAPLQGTNFQDAILNGTDLSGTFMVGTNFQGANMLDVNLTGATLVGVDLRNTTNLTAEQLAAAAMVDATTLLPPEIAATPDSQ